MTNYKGKDTAVDIIRSSIIAVIISICLTLILSVIMHYVDMSDNLISGLNIALRALSLVMGLGIGIRHLEGGILKGIITACLYVLLTYLIYSLIASDFSFGKTKVIDSIASVVFGIISGILAVNMKRER